MFLNNLKYVKLLETKSGTSKNGDQWSLQNFLFEYSDGVKLSLQSWNKDLTLKENKSYNVSVQFESREYKGKYYTNGSISNIEEIQEEPKGFKPELPTEKDEPLFGELEVDNSPF